MRIVAELIGGVVLLLIFAWGVDEAVKFFSNREKKNVDVQREQQPNTDAAPGTGEKPN